MIRRFFLLAFFLVPIATVSRAPAPAAAAPAACTIETFAALNLPETTITLVESLPAGTNSAPVGNIALPICRVRGVIAPANLFEVWMPTADWNGKFQALGNGGLAGSISFGDMRTAVSRNYAAASTDTGHSSNAAGDPWWTNAQQIKDYGYRSIHELTLKSKAIINALYGADPDRSYFVGCSTGGRQAFMEAQRYPGDYDGIIAGAPVYRVIELRARHVWTWQCNQADPTGAHAIPVSKLSAIFNAVVAACDRRDGLEDGQVDDPRRCRFNPETLLCTDADNDSCLTAPQIETLKCMYAGPVNPRTRKQVYPGVPATSELDQGPSIGAVPNPQYTTFFQNTVFEDTNYDFLTFNFDTDLKFALNKKFDGETLEFIHQAEDPDLTAFKKRGGKMIIWHGFSDPLPSPVDTIDYYNSIRARSNHSRRDAEKTEEFVRLFLLPNVGHCGGPAAGGPNQFDPLTALEQWIEEGIAPEEIIASRVTDGVVTRTRPICAYPQTAQYVGSGSIDDAANFVCRQPHDRDRPHDHGR
ncbi:MAG TPA: tannase/feruloyl esterase family alpha/beta hydrolase [Candidatus Binatia bacterium]